MRFLSLVLLLGAAVSFVSADAKDDALAKEVKKFEGTWVLVSGEKEGKPVPAEDIKNSKLTKKGKETTVVAPHLSKEPMKVKFDLDPSKSPKEIDWVRGNGPDAGKKMLAIYEWIDPDQYRLVFAPAGKDRPKEFATKAGSGQIMHVWKRAKE